MHTATCPHCNRLVPLPGPRLMAMTYLPLNRSLWRRCKWLLVQEERYLVMVDEQDAVAIDLQPCVRHYVYARKEVV